MHTCFMLSVGFFRRYAVSELLPESGNVEQAPAAAGKGGKGGKGAAGKPAAPLVPQGKAKAEALIAAGKTHAVGWLVACSCSLLYAAHFVVPTLHTLYLVNVATVARLVTCAVALPCVDAACGSH